MVQAPSTVKYRKEPPAPIKCDFSNERLQYCVDIAVLVERCDRFGYMAAYLSGMRWEAIQEAMQGKVAADIRRFRKELREGGYAID
ncbi:MAG: hypothetical protein IH628_11400 [Proteobacteria bacterium]|nr:hypothetical protein [Pseudomonadota bacterium]